MTVYGPYKRKDGRQHVIHYIDGKRRTQSYPRFLMEKEIGRELLKEEHVDHINGDPTDDRIDNLQILSQLENNRKLIDQSGHDARMKVCWCPVCDARFEILWSQYRANQIKQGKQGPYCSKRCNGIENH
jgi:HNH endonuclease